MNTAFQFIGDYFQFKNKITILYYKILMDVINKQDQNRYKFHFQFGKFK